MEMYAIMLQTDDISFYTCFVSISDIKQYTNSAK